MINECLSVLFYDKSWLAAEGIETKRKEIKKEKRYLDKSTQFSDTMLSVMVFVRE